MTLKKVRSLEVSHRDAWTRGEAINSARRKQLPDQKLFLFFNGVRYATILSPDLEGAKEFGKTWGLDIDEYGLEEIPPVQTPQRKPWILRMKMKFKNFFSKFKDDKNAEDFWKDFD